MPITKATASSVAPAAKGDLVVGSATNDAAVLGVGANGTVLTAASGEATGLQWATPSSGGMTLLSTTTLSGASTTISSISGSYKNLYAVVSGFTNTGSNDYFIVRPNNASTVNNAAYGNGKNPVSFNDYGIALTFPANPYQPNKDNANNVTVFEIHNYASTTTYKTFTSGGLYTSMSPDVTTWFNCGTYTSNTAVTSLVFSNIGGGNLSTGTVLLYGVN
jgi:hypothetical protein